VRQDEPSQDRRHERIGAAIREKPMDPTLEAAAEHEVTSEHLVLAKGQEEETDGDSESRQGTVIRWLCDMLPLLAKLSIAWVRPDRLSCTRWLGAGWLARRCELQRGPSPPALEAFP
jgi:hypothetical protein